VRIKLSYHPATIFYSKMPSIGPQPYMRTNGIYP